MNKTVVVTGATGFVGRKLVLGLLKNNFSVKVITRSIATGKKKLPLPVTFVEWDSKSPLSSEVFEGAYGVIHLAGESLSVRWTPEVKKEILVSRTEGTKLVIDAINKCTVKPQVVVGTSAIGIYGDRGSELLHENSSDGQGFLADVCKAWENAYAAYTGRLALIRVGVVLGHGGALEKMMLPFRLGIGGKIGSGKAYLSWVHIDDLVNIYITALQNQSYQGPYNAVAPNPVQNSDFTKSLAKTLNRPAIFPVPTFGLKILFGEMSQVVLMSQNVSSKKLLSQGFTFKFSNIDEALKDLLSPLGIKGTYTFEDYKWIQTERNKVFPFFAEAKNLESITPEWLNFKIKKLSTPDIQEGTLIDYKLKIKGIPIGWKTLIKNWKPSEQFTDTQLKGPYNTWHHTHSFYDLSSGTLMEDKVIYKMPFGILGDVVRYLWVQHDVSKIFNHRSQVIEKLFK